MSGVEVNGGGGVENASDNVLHSLLETIISEFPGIQKADFGLVARIDGYRSMDAFRCTDYGPVQFH